MKCLLVLSCLLPVLFGKPSPFFGLFDDIHDSTSEKEHACALHLDDACIGKYLSSKRVSEVKPTFETCRVIDLMNCLEKEINATTDCHRDGKVNHTRIRSVQFNFVNAKRCPCAEDLDELIEILTAPDDVYPGNVLVIGHDTEDAHEDWHDDILSDEDGDGLGHYDSLLDHEDSWAETENATAPHTEEENDENNTKDLFGKAPDGKKGVHKSEEEFTTDVKNHNASRNSTDGDVVDNYFMSYLQSLLSPHFLGDFDGGNEGNTKKSDMANPEGLTPDGMHGDSEDSHEEDYEEGIGMGKNSSDYSPKVTEISDSDSFNELFGGESDTHDDSGYPTDSGTKTDGHADDDHTYDDGMTGSWEDVVPEYDEYDYHK